MDFTLPQETQELQAKVRKFVQDYLLPLEPEVLRRRQQAQGLDAELPPEIENDLLNKTKKAGLWGLTLPKEYGGKGISALSQAVVEEELFKTITPFEIPPETANFLVLERYGTEDQKQRYLIPYVKGDLVSCILATERVAGSDVKNIETSAERDGDNWVINGTKVLIHKAGRAHFGILLAVTDKTKGRDGMTIFIADLKGVPGVTIKPIPTIYNTVYEVKFDNVIYPDKNRLGGINEGWKVIQSRFGRRRLFGGANMIGFAVRALEMSIKHAKSRETFGQPLAQRQAVQLMITEMATNIYASRMMLYNTIWKEGQGEDVRNEIAIIKFFTSEMAGKAIDDAIQIHGGFGLTTEYPLETMLRSYRRMRIAEGPNEILKWVVARNLLRD
ncbi:acyl-CoA dehydrogenase family protein [Chloroflexota bacterium]